MPKYPTEVVANVHKAREAALLAVETYNRPWTACRSARVHRAHDRRVDSPFPCHLLQETDKAARHDLS